jgi:hypothetical protein
MTLPTPLKINERDILKEQRLARLRQVLLLGTKRPVAAAQRGLDSLH